jgi:hypothetical protein
MSDFNTEVNVGWVTLEIDVDKDQIDILVKGDDSAVVQRYEKGEVVGTLAGTVFRIHAPGTVEYDPGSHLVSECQIGGCVGCETLAYRAGTEGLWQCPDGHMYAYEPPPAYPPFCGRVGCFAPGEHRWIIKDEVTGRDWPKEPDTIAPRMPKHRGLMSHNGLQLHSHEVRDDHFGVPKMNEH